MKRWSRIEPDSRPPRCYPQAERLRGALQTERGLPQLTARDVAAVRLELSGRGFALLDTQPFFDDGPFAGLKKASVTLRCHDKRWVNFPHLARYACWLEDVLAEALPEEVVHLVALELRHEPAGTENAEVDGLHADRAYLRSVCT